MQSRGLDCAGYEGVNHALFCSLIETDRRTSDDGVRMVKML